MKIVAQDTANLHDLPDEQKGKFMSALGFSERL
jgi:hypothetical protein